MSESRYPKYPVFIPSKGRADKAMTARMFLQDGVDFKIVVEPQEREVYAAAVGEDYVLTLPESGKGLVFARNWIRDYAVAHGHERHWQFDDDVRYMTRLLHGYRLRCPSRVAMVVAEEFVDRYENVGLASFNSEFFVPCANGTAQVQWPPFYLNHRCYTDFLMLNSLPYRWRYRYNEDTDMTLQVLSGGWCTILFNAFLIKTPRTMTSAGGQTDIYVSDGRLRMAKQLERVWPGVVTTSRRFQRPQHIVRNQWESFDTPLKLKQGIVVDAGDNEHGLELVAVDQIKDEGLRALVEGAR